MKKCALNYVVMEHNFLALQALLFSLPFVDHQRMFYLVQVHSIHVFVVSPHSIIASFIR